MKIVKSSKGTQETMLNIILILGGIFLVGALLQYGNNKSMTKDLMTSSNNVNNTRNMNEINLILHHQMYKQFLNHKIVFLHQVMMFLKINMNL